MTSRPASPSIFLTDVNVREVPNIQTEIPKRDKRFKFDLFWIPIRSTTLFHSEITVGQVVKSIEVGK